MGKKYLTKAVKNIKQKKHIRKVSTAMATLETWETSGMKHVASFGDFPAEERDSEMSDFEESERPRQRPRRTKSADRDECMNINGEYRKTPRKATNEEAPAPKAEEPTSPVTPRPSAPPHPGNPTDEVQLGGPRLKRASSEDRILQALQHLRGSIQTRLRTMSIDSRDSKGNKKDAGAPRSK